MVAACARVRYAPQLLKAAGACFQKRSEFSHEQLCQLINHIATLKNMSLDDKDLKRRQLT